MKLIFKIAKNELRNLFYSPIAWLTLLVFWVIASLTYCNNLYSMANTQEIMIKNSNPGWNWLPNSLTGGLFSGIYKNAASYLYLFIPLLTMGLVSRERNEDTMRLLFSSPVTTRQVVLGKYLGIVCYLLMLVAVIVVFMVLGFLNIHDADYGLFFSGALGFYLLVCAYAAIGLYMSSLSIHFIISGIGTFMVIFVLDRIGMLWQEYDFIRDLTWFLSLQHRTQTMVMGLIITRDIFYFLVVAFIFVCFTIIKLRSERESKPWYIKAGRYALVMVLALVVGYTSSRPMLTAYWDTTAAQKNTIPKEMQALIKAMGDSSLEVTLFDNLLSTTSMTKKGFPVSRNPEYFAGFWEPYLRFKPDINFKYEYYYDIDPRTSDSIWYQRYPGKSVREIATKVAQRSDIDLTQFKTPEQIRKVADMTPEYNRMVMQLKYRGRTEILRTMDDLQTWPGLSNVAAVFKRLLEPEKISKTYFVTGDLERNIHIMGERGYSGHTAKWERQSIINMGLDVDTLNLNFQNIPGNTKVLVLADPIMDLSPVVQAKIRSYIDAGGNMMILGKPGKQYVMNPVLKQLGVQLHKGQIVQPSYDETHEKVISLFTPEAINLSFEAGGGPIGTPTVTAVVSDSNTNYTNKPLLLTQKGKTWLKAGSLVIDSTLPPFNAAAGDVMKDSLATATHLTRRINDKEQRVLVFGGADFISNMRLLQNTDFIRAAHSWLTYNHFPIDIPIVMPKDVLLNIGERAAKVQKITFIWVLPGLILLLGSILLIRRKRK
ncbi:ABC transporter permease subunit [Niabella sp. CJ426]|uniref:ABC transporter permease subunit n=1 Tax=Niabella sp. CJ426 TaxID=3393740 RepID=UPI003CFE1D88